MEKFLVEIESVLPCRHSQIKDILSYISEKDEPVPPCLFLYGSSASGKTTCIKKILEFLNYKHIILNAVECYSQKIVYETILNTISGHEYTITAKYATLYKCDNMMDFITYLNDVNVKYSYEPIVIVIDNADRLRDLELNILPVFIRLKEYCTLNICTVLISNVIYEKYYIKTGIRDPIKIHFPQYTKDELFKIIALNRLECVNYVLRKSSADVNIQKDIQREDVFANYLNAFLSVFYRACRDLVELKYMCRINYMKYCEPILEGSINVDDITKLWRNITPTLKNNLEMLYLRLNPIKSQVIKSNEYIMENKMAHLGITKADVEILGNDSKKTITDELTSTKTYAQNFELPFYAKFLLIAAYLASFNPTKEDKRLFMKNHGKQRKRMQQVLAKAKINEKLNLQLGPKVFTLDRLLAIFYAIVEERVGLTANLLIQISSLVNLRLLTTSADCTKYKCIVSYDFIVAISKTVGFNIRKYLYDLL